MKALALVDDPDHVCCRYRVLAFEPELRRAGVELKVEGLARAPLARVRQFVRVARFDLVLLQRKLLPGWQLAILRGHARRLVFDFDDAVLFRDSYDPRGIHDRRRAARFAKIMRAADLVIAGNDYLLELARENGATGRCIVIPTCVDPASYPRALGSGRGDGIDLLWVGSSSTLQGLEREAGLFDRLNREIPGLRLRLIADRSTTLGALPVEFVPWSKTRETVEIARGDVGISLVPDDPWSRGKCGLKLLQYQAAGLPVVANPIGVHPAMIKPGINGFLARSAEEWVEAIRLLSANPSLRARLGAAGRESVEAGFSVESWAANFVSALAGGRPIRSPIRRQPQRVPTTRERA